MERIRLYVPKAVLESLLEKIQLQKERIASKTEELGKD
jgi:hypothetical protein